MTNCLPAMLFIDYARTVCTAGFMKLSGVRPYVCLSVRLCHPSPRCTPGLLRAGDIDLLLHSRRSAAANTSSVSRDQLTQQAEQRRCLTVCPATAMVVKQTAVATEHFWHPSACQQWSFMSSSSQFSSI